MIDDLHDLEKELAALRPVKPGDDFAQAMRDRLANDDEADAALERELHSLVPTQPPPAMARRLAVAQSGSGTAPRRWQSALWAVAAAAIVVAAVQLLNPPATDAQDPPEPPSPVAAAPGPATDDSAVVSEALAFSDPRAQAMLAAGYKPVALQQVVLDTNVVEPAQATENGELRVHILQAIRWNHDRTGAQVDTKQIHEAVIRHDLTVY